MPIFDRIGIPVDLPTANIEICVVVDQDLFGAEEEEEVGRLTLEFRNRESARFEGREVALYPEVAFEEQYGRSPDDDGANEMLMKVRRLRQRILALIESTTGKGDRISTPGDEATISQTSLSLPQRFLFYWLRWPSPHLGLEICVRWEKPIRRT